jgi:trimeric autotransporter adhesin
MTITLNGTTGITTPALDNQGNLTVDGGTIKLDGNYPVGTGSVALGDTALDSVQSAGTYNTAIGHNALTANTTATNNTSVGAFSLGSNTTGEANTAVGLAALDANTTGSNNVGLGRDALGSNNSANNNTAVGYQALYNSNSRENIAVGSQAGKSLISGEQCAFVGHYSGNSTTGSRNNFFGEQSGYLVTTGSNNTILGRYSGNQGGLDIRTSSNNIVLSDGDGNPRVWINSSGYIHSLPTYNNTTGSGANLHVESSGQFVRSTSSLRYKNTVNDATHGLTELLSLRPVTYKGNNDGDTVFGGLIAEEVHDAGLTEFVQYNDDGEPDALAYSNMVSLCIKAIQEQQATITALTARITALEGN